MIDFDVALAMPNDAWRERLRTAVEKSKWSMRALSLKAGYSPGYIHGVLKENKQPGFQRLQKVCSLIPVSLSYIVFGIEQTPDEEKLLNLFAQLDPERKELFLSLAASQARPDSSKDAHTPDTTSPAASD